MKALYINRDGSIRIDAPYMDGEYERQIVQVCKYKRPYQIPSVDETLNIETVEYMHRGRIGVFAIYEEL